jgi:hypothetical protein
MPRKKENVAATTPVFSEIQSGLQSSSDKKARKSFIVFCVFPLPEEEVVFVSGAVQH